MSTTATEAEIIAGGKTMVLTMPAGNLWVASAAFDALRQDIIDGLSGTGSGTGAFNAKVRPLMVVGNVVRTSDTVVTITLPAAPEYSISQPEFISFAIPTAAVQGGYSATVEPNFTITQTLGGGGGGGGGGPLAAGTYDVLLSMPDSATSIRARADYAIRTANNDTWETVTGYNDLGHQIEVGGATPGQTTVPYTASTAVVRNPEVGPYMGYAYLDHGTSLADHAVELEGLMSTRAVNLVRAVFNLRPYRAQADIPTSFQTNTMQASFDTARDLGIKLAVLFAYDFSGDADNDPGLARCLEHIASVAAMCNANKDVIAFYHMGFIGKWGEEHSSGNFTDDNWSDEPWADRVTLLQAILDAFDDRPVVTRYVRLLRWFLGEEVGGTGTPRVTGSERLGIKNDSFLADDSQGGSYEVPDTRGDFAWLEAWLASEGAAGRPRVCSVEQESFGWSDAQKLAAFGQFETQHVSTVSHSYHPDNVELFEDTMHPTEGMSYWEVVKRRIGYRLELQEATFPNAVAVGEDIDYEIELENTGWAAPYSQRDVVIVLRNTVSGDLHEFTLADDPRDWAPGSAITLTGSLTVT